VIQPSAITKISKITIGIAIQSKIARHAPDSDRPPRSSHAKQIAHTDVPPSVSTQQSPHTGLPHRAHGPAAVAPHRTHRSTPPPLLP
jgi:hypothetical protein